MPYGRPEPKVTVEASILVNAKLARQSLARNLTSTSPSGEAIMGVMETTGRSVVEDHPGARVTIAFWKCTCGDLSEDRLKREVLACIPSESQNFTKDQSVAKLEALGRSKLYSFLSLGPKALFTTVERFVGDIKRSRTPTFDTAKNSTFMQAVMTATSRWITFSNGSAKELVTVHGSEAAKMIFEKVAKAQTQNKISEHVDDICELRIFAWLLTATQREQVGKFSEDAAAQNLEGSALATLCAPKAKAKAGRKKAAMTGRNAVLSMLGV